MKTGKALAQGTLWLVFIAVLLPWIAMLTVLDMGGKPEPLYRLIERLNRWRRRFVRQPSEG